jgi:hypothetical protein
MAANGLLRYGMSAAFPLFTVQSKLLTLIPVFRLTSDQSLIAISVSQDGYRLGHELSWFLLNTHVTHSVGAFQMGSKHQIEEQL